MALNITECVQLADSRDHHAATTDTILCLIHKYQYCLLFSVNHYYGLSMVYWSNLVIDVVKIPSWLDH